MSNYNNVNTHTAGGLEGLALGAPIGGGSATTGAGSGLISSSNTAGGIGSGLTGSSHQHGSGLTGSSSTGTGIGSGLTGSSHQHGSGLTGSSTTGTGSSAYDQGAANSTSGERGIGGGRGGPTAFESDATRVGTTGGAGDHGHVGHEHGQHGHSHGTGITGPTGTGAGDDKAAIKALTGAGHHDQSRVGQYDSGATTGTGTHGSHGHGLAATAAAGGAGLGAAGLASHGHRGGEVDDSVTGQEHFRSQVGEKTAGNVGRASTLTGAGAGAGLGHGSSATSQGAPVASGGAGYGAGSLAAAGAGAGAAAVGAGSHGHGHSHGNNPVSELKQELKDHQSGPGYDKAEHHTETEGPHGLVWHNGKYVHKREIEGKGSTGVPLK